MAGIGRHANLLFTLDGKVVNAPVEWADIAVLASFDDDAVQANVTIDQFTFVREEAAYIREYIRQGLTGGKGIFSGIPMAITAINSTDSKEVFTGYIDLTDGFEDDVINGRVKCKIKKGSGLNTFNDQLEALTYGFLASKGVFKDSDYITIAYVVARKNQAMEILIATVTTYMLTKELYESRKELRKSLLTAASLFVAGGLSGPIAQTLQKIGDAIIRLAYTAVMLIAIANVVNQLLNMLIPPKRQAKVIPLKTLLSNVCNYLGFNFNTNISDLNTLYYLPSNQRFDNIDKNGLITKTKGTPTGIPYNNDFGYYCADMFQLIKSLFDGRYAIIDETVHFYNQYDSFWNGKATFTLPSILQPPKTYNTGDLAFTQIYSFTTDLTDDWTLDNFTGTNYEVLTDSVTEGDLKGRFIKGLSEVTWQAALGNRKENNTPLDDTLLVLAGVADTLSKVFGGSSNFKAKVKNQKGMLKVSQNDYALPKLLPLVGGKLPSNHRSLLSAKKLYSSYHYGKSFVSHKHYGQKEIYVGVRIPFGFSDFLLLINNSFFTTFEGKEAKAIKIEWNMASDTAKIDYWIRAPYTHNLQETFIEP